jgi:hypothetical protein
VLGQESSPIRPTLPVRSHPGGSLFWLDRLFQERSDTPRSRWPPRATLGCTRLFVRGSWAGSILSVLTGINECVENVLLLKADYLREAQSGQKLHVEALFRGGLEL